MISIRSYVAGNSWVCSKISVYNMDVAPEFASFAEVLWVERTIILIVILSLKKKKLTFHFKSKCRSSDWESSFRGTRVCMKPTRIHHTVLPLVVPMTMKRCCV